VENTTPQHTGDIRSIWQLLALDDSSLEKVDVVVLNLVVAKEIPALADLDIARYVRTVDDWTRQFRQVLPGMEQQFRKTPSRWKNDIRFFRVGMLMGFLGHEIGLRYIEEQKHGAKVSYTNPGDLFLNGLIDTKQGTCGNMPALHAAMARRMGWSVSLACADSHFISRFDDGQVVHNIEATSTHPGSFAEGSDEDYIKRFALPEKAIECGSDLRKLSAREMVGAFLSLRGRHYTDTRRPLEADSSFALARALLPTHRCAYIGAMAPMLARGATLFNPGEVGHPDSLFQEVETYLPPPRSSGLNQQIMGLSLPLPPAKPVVVDSVVDILRTSFGFSVPEGPKRGFKQEGQ
jgi:hypothetical protein